MTVTLPPLSPDVIANIVGVSALVVLILAVTIYTSVKAAIIAAAREEEARRRPPQ